MKYFISDHLYTILKWVGLIACPAIAVFVGTVGQAWGWNYIEPTVITINAIGVLIGALIGISAATAKTVSNDEYFKAPADGDEIPADDESFKVLTEDEAKAVFEDANQS